MLVCRDGTVSLLVRVATLVCNALCEYLSRLYIRFMSCGTVRDEDVQY